MRQRERERKTREWHIGLPAAVNTQVGVRQREEVRYIT